MTAQGGARSPVSPRQIADDQRREKAVQLRLAGATFEQIAEQCGYTDRSSAYGAVRLAVQRIGREQAEELFDIDMARLDRLLMAVWPAAMRGEDKAVNNALKIMERRARMLGYEGVTINTGGETSAMTTTGPTLAELLGTDAGELEQRMARVLHDAMPTVINTDDDDAGDGTDG